MKKIIIPSAEGVGIISVVGDPEVIAPTLGLSVYRLVEEEDLPKTPTDTWIFDPESPTGISTRSGPIVGSKQWKIKQKDLLAAKRFSVETGGVNWNGHVLKSDRESQAMLTGALVMSSAFPEGGIGWKFVDGFAQVTASDVQSMANTLMNHVQACFAIESAKQALIEAGEDPNLESGWPN